MSDTISDRVAVLRREHNDRAWLAWNTAALSRIPPSKKLPPLKALLAQEPRKRRTLTWQEQFAVMQQWVAVTNRKKQR